MENRIEDKDGVWILNENGATWDLVEPSKEFLDNLNKPIEEPSAPSEEELNNAAFEIKLIESLMGLGLL